ncbi:leucine-rich repeat-containing protein 71-like isoform X2 [Cynoglossus semilaevis]|uniref:Leucine rich repeat containing 71 n=1 Tax=Cynoglossus semilaevis TaxID=244447 RepID=A0A3P8VHR6_CYNSE|nr:leucine-rich repeat-containing protein 71-like isoform X2 [Cynoglossus semilaevis]
MSKRRHAKEKADKAAAAAAAGADDDKRSEGAQESTPAQTFNSYQCTGNVEADFPALCALLSMGSTPLVRQVACSSASPASQAVEIAVPCKRAMKNLWWKQRLRVELESDDPLSAKSIRISGWKIDEQMTKVLQKILPSLINLQSLHFWQADLTDKMVASLLKTVSVCSNLRILALEGNPLPDESYHCILSAKSVLTEVSLRNNQIDDNAALAIGSAISTTRTSNKNLLSLCLAFNCIGDEGAAHIAKGLRFNRSLLFLSLAHNLIGDSGAAHLAEVLGEFALTHEEVVERRKLLLEKQSSCPDSEPAYTDKPTSVPSSVSTVSVSKADKKGTPKKKSQGGAKKREKPASKEKTKRVSQVESKCDEEKQPEVEVVKIGNPLLDPPQKRDGQLFLPGNKILAYLNLAGNRITEKSLPLFLTSLEMQGEKGGLLHLCLQRNCFPSECESHDKIQELLTPKLEKEPWKPIPVTNPV